jgi:hypothetical protein
VTRGVGVMRRGAEAVQREGVVRGVGRAAVARAGVLVRGSGGREGASPLCMKEKPLPRASTWRVVLLLERRRLNTALYGSTGFKILNPKPQTLKPHLSAPSPCSSHAMSRYWLSSSVSKTLRP